MTYSQSESSNKFQSFRIMTEFGDGRMNLRMLVLKSEKLSAFLRPGSSLSHSMIVDGKTNFEEVIVCIKKGNI